MCAASFHSYGALSRAKFALQREIRQDGRRRAHVERCPAARAAARDTSSSQAFATRGRSPLPSAPSTSTTPPRQSTRRTRPRRAGGGAVAPAARPPSRRRGSRRCCARARSRRCSTAPADALQTAGVTSAARRSGITTPSRPRTSAVRQIAPRFCGSWTSSSATSSGRRAREQLAARRRTGRARPRRRRPGGRRCRARARQLAPASARCERDARAVLRRPDLAARGRRPARSTSRDRVAPVDDHGTGTSSGPAGPSRTSQPRARSSSRSRSASAKSLAARASSRRAQQRLGLLARLDRPRRSSRFSSPRTLEHLAQVVAAHAVARVGLADPLERAPPAPRAC